MKHGITAQFNLNMQQLAPFEPQPDLVVAVSGGADSLCLCYLAKAWAEERGGRVIAVTIDHRLRPESADEALRVNQILSSRGIPHHILPWVHDGNFKNLQAAARAARYNLLTNFCRKHDILHQLVAHHEGDQAETVYMRLQRGSGVDGLSAMPLTTPCQKINLIRPLLNITKQQILAYMAEGNHEWISDPSNENMKFDRISCRKFIANYQLMEPELFSKRLCATASNMGRARAALEEATASQMVGCNNIYPEGYSLIKLNAFLDCTEEIALRILVSNLVTISGKSQKPRFASLYPLYLSIKAGETATRTLHGCMLIFKQNNLLIMREPSNISEDRYSIGEEPLLWDNRFTISRNLPANAIVSKCSNEDYLFIKNITNFLKSPRFNKKILFTLPIIKDQDKIIAIPQIDYYTNIEQSKQINCNFTPLLPLAMKIFEPICS